MDVPVFVRTYDDMFSSFHAASMAACCGLTFSFSNYSLSYKLLRRIGFWDTNEEAIAEDFHMCLKAHFKTNGELKTVPIYAPFNQLNIQTGNGYCEDIKAKFWQL
jgi:cellulose synthase/poly-beta-1,6-N-acetylglucosamine synthase-like glycosyltransferase